MQLLDQLKAKVATFSQDRNKVVLVACIVAGVMVIGLLIILIAPSTGRSGSAELAAGEATPVPTYTIEEVEALTQAPPRPTDIPFIKKEDLVIDPPTVTPTPLPGIFFEQDGTHNDLTIYLDQRNAGDVFDEVNLVSLRTKEERLLGYTYHLAPGDSAYFSRDFSQIIFIGGSKSDHQRINTYSIQQNKIIKSISLDQIKKALPALQINEIAVMSSMQLSPDKSKAAFSYGLTFNTTPIHPQTQMIIINLQTDKMQLLPVKGLVKQWKDDTTLEYEVQESGTAPRVTQEVQVTGI